LEKIFPFLQIDARYKMTYSITREELLWLEERVKHLGMLTEKQCTEKIVSFIPIEKIDFHKETWCFFNAQIKQNSLLFLLKRPPYTALMITPYLLFLNPL